MTADTEQGGFLNPLLDEEEVVHLMWMYDADAAATTYRTGIKAFPESALECADLKMCGIALGFQSITLCLNLPDTICYVNIAVDPEFTFTNRAFKHSSPFCPFVSEDLVIP